VTTEAAETAMIAKAKEIGLKKAAQQKVSQFLSKQGVEMPHLSIFQFCTPMGARLMVMAEVVETAIRVNQQMLDVMTAGASGKT
jgi:uncharacterized protein (DUF302 family)